MDTVTRHMHALHPAGLPCAVRRLLAAELPTAEQPDACAASVSCHLVTGGLGSLGMLCARWLLARGAGAGSQHVLLQGRSGRGATAGLLAGAAALGGQTAAVVHLQRCDAASTDEALHHMRGVVQARNSVL
jgi:hypothetical protein